MTYLPALTIPSQALPNSASNYIAPIPSKFGVNGADVRLDGHLSSRDSVHGTVH
jgi:hypothetical protein